MPNVNTPRDTGLQIGALILVSLLLSFGNVAFTQEKQIRKEAVQQSVPLSGAGMFKEHCAVCHGKDAKGGGPAASELKQAPADLTTLAKRHNRIFPDDYVANVLRNGVKAPAHGDAEMPVWGPLFSSMDSDPAIMYMRISSLVSYVKSLQVK
ncbi:MAG: c-type cytochrome [Gaiellaceae bacterium]